MHVNEALNDNNYLDWVQEMETLLFAKNKIGFVDGTMKKPETTHDNHMLWLRCDAMIRGWLTTAMDKEIRYIVRYANSAEEIWKDLQERFGKDNAPRAYELKRLLTLTKQDGSSVSAYYTRLRTLWDEIGTILAIKPTPSLGEAFRLVSEDEQQRAVSTGKGTNTDSAALQAFVKREGSVAPQNRFIHKSSKKPNNDKVDHCDFYGKYGHKRDGCFKLVGYPEWWPGKSKTEKTKPKAACVEESPLPGLTNEQYQQFLSMFGNQGPT
ncbi:uncharacterized protein LOC143567550 [Bidens hawaiensis]|uniref:uncharacterized protein LOC143567550 n=1 Tax=Bidens hawaiensis TaxID=980011 RepID=UPI00404B874E